MSHLYMITKIRYKNSILIKIKFLFGQSTRTLANLETPQSDVNSRLFGLHFSVDPTEYMVSSHLNLDFIIPIMIIFPVLFLKQANDNHNLLSMS